MSALHTIRFPNEPDEYRQARDDLLRRELELRKELEHLAEQRRRLPLGGAVNEDYVFDDVTTGQRVRLSELFAAGKDTLILYSFMYAPDAEQPCPMCNSITDSFNGTARHVGDRVNFAIVAKAPVQKLKQWAQQRGWSDLRLLSSNNNRYNADYFAETEDGDQLPAFNVFVRRDGKIHHYYALEALYAKVDGQPRHADLLWPLWNLLDLTPEGRGSDWYPKLSYDAGA